MKQDRRGNDSRGGPAFQIHFPFIATREGFLLYRKMVIVSIDQHRQTITRSAVVLKDADITEVGAPSGPIRIH